MQVPPRWLGKAEASGGFVIRGGVSIVSTYVFWNHHEWKEGEWDFSGNRDLSAFLGEVKKAGLWAVVRIGPWAHGECREGGFPDWLVDKAYGWPKLSASSADATTTPSSRCNSPDEMTALFSHSRSVIQGANKFSKSSAAPVAVDAQAKGTPLR